MRCEYCRASNADDEERCLRCGRPLPAGGVRAIVGSAVVPEVAERPRVVPFQPQGQRARRPLQPVLRQGSLFPEDSAESPAGSGHAPPPATRPAERKKAAPGGTRFRGEKKREAGPLLAALEARPSPPGLPGKVSVQCEAKVADLGLRAQAALLDMLIVLLGFLFFLALLSLARPWIGPLPTGLWPALIYAGVYVLLLAWYKIAAAAYGRCTVGLRRMGLEVLRFSGHPPSVGRRLLRVFGGFVTGGAGFLWPLIEPERLAIPDIVSETFVTPSKTRR